MARSNYVGAIPIPVEPDLETYNIDPFLIEKSITKSTKAIILVHLYGLTCAMENIQKIAKENNLYLVEDCAQALGSSYKDQKAGPRDAASFSFYPTKNLGALGDGGMITTSNLMIFEKIKKLRNYGSIEKYKNDLIGVNSRLDELQASFLRLKLKNINEENKKRNLLARIYFKKLNKISNFIKLPFYEQDTFYHSWHLFVVLTKQRKELANHLKQNKIETIFHYPIPPHKQNCFKNNKIFSSSYPLSEKIHNECISLPISSLHSELEINYVCDKVLSFLFNKIIFYERN